MRRWGGRRNLEVNLLGKRKVGEKGHFGTVSALHRTPAVETVI